MDDAPLNMDKPVIEVNHKDLERFSEDSPFKSKCPVCKEGILLLGLDLENWKFREYDRCVGCGQQVKYKDINELNKMLQKT
jgi:hypothetical protein